MKYKNIFYFSQLNSIGGVETFFYYLARKYKDWDIVIFYKEGDDEQVKRLRKYVRAVQFKGQTIECERAFFNYNTDILDYVIADEYYQLIHGDYTKFNIQVRIDPRIKGFYGVSQLVCDKWKEVTGRDAEAIYNPIVIDKPQKILHLISATRLTKEKGLERILQLADALDKAEIKYEWTIYTDHGTPLSNPNIYFRPPRLDITDCIAESDYLVQLSDTEGYCFSVVEALSLGVPVIVTDCPVFTEIGVKDGKTGFILDFDMGNIPVEKIAKGLPKFEYKPIEDKWSDILAKGESQYQKDMKTKVKIVVTKPYFDLELKKDLIIGDVIEVSKVRADYIIENGYARYNGGILGQTQDQR